MSYLSNTPTRGMLQPRGAQAGERLNFQFNPSTISEERTVKYNFSEAQGQYMPIAQFGMIEPTQISFSLFFYNNGGLANELAALRRLMTPRNFTDANYYQKSTPLQYALVLGDYGVFVGVVEDLTMKVEKYQYQTMVPQHISAQIRFKAVSGGASFDVRAHRSQTGRT